MRGTTPGQPVVAMLDDDQAIRDSLAALLEASGWAVAAFDGAEEFHAWRAVHAADAYVIDVKLSSGGDGLAMLQGLRAAGDETPAIIVTGHADSATLRRALDAGACEVLDKPFPAALLLTTLRQALGGVPGGARARVAGPPVPLTERERMVLDGLAAGRTRRGLAVALGVEPGGIEADRDAVLRKLGARSLFQAMRSQHAAP